MSSDSVDDRLERDSSNSGLAEIVASEKPKLSEEAVRFHSQHTRLRQIIGEYIGASAEELNGEHCYSREEWEKFLGVMRYLAQDDTTLSPYISRLADPTKRNRIPRSFVANSNVDQFKAELAKSFTPEDLRGAIKGTTPLGSIIKEKIMQLPVLRDRKEYVGINAAVGWVYKMRTKSGWGRRLLVQAVNFTKNHEELRTYLHRFRDEKGSQVRDYVRKDKLDDFLQLLDYHLPAKIRGPQRR
jgi:hypothetical protein